MYEEHTRRSGRKIKPNYGWKITIGIRSIDRRLGKGGREAERREKATARPLPLTKRIIDPSIAVSFLVLEKNQPQKIRILFR
jgi:hypothetical protein